MSVYKYDHQCILFSQKAIVKSTNLRKKKIVWNTKNKGLAALKWQF